MAIFSQIKAIVFAASLSIIVGGGWYLHSTLERNKQLEKTISTQQRAIQELNRAVARIQEQKEKQEEAVASLRNSNQDLNAEIRDYLQIFQNHDLTELARAKPGLIENRVNSGTQNVFNQLETDTHFTSTN